MNLPTPTTRLAVALAAVAWVCSASEVRSEGPRFVPAPGSPVTVGLGSGEVVLADLDRDGHLDLLTKHLLQRSLTVCLGDGKGRFSVVAERMTFEYQPGTIALGDVDADGVLDLVVASKDADGEHVHVFRGDGKGRFRASAPARITVSASMELYKPTLRLVDVDEDEKVDIVTANGRRNRIEILLGDGRDGFSKGPVVHLAPGGDFHSFALGDVDGDAHLDVVAASSTQTKGSPGRLAVKRGDGKGGFTDVPGSPSVLSGPRVGTLADVDGDRRLDVVLTHDGDRLSVLLNRGAATFAPAPLSPYDIGARAHAVVATDVDGDRRIDLVAATVSSVTVLLGGPRGFGVAAGSPFPAGPGAYNVAVGDLDEDGRLDLAASAFEGTAVTVLLGR